MSTTTETFENVGSNELARATTAWLACLAFAVTFLLAVALADATTTTAFVRGGIVAAAVRFLGYWLVRPAVDAVVAAMARDRAIQAETLAAAQAEEDAA